MNPAVLVAQDLACYGQVSLGVALPVLGAAGLAPTPLPTALLSTHTGGFGKPAFCDLHAQVRAICTHWEALNLRFQAAYLGYLGGQIPALFNTGLLTPLLKDAKLVLIDPVLGDHGKLYSGFDQAYVNQVKTLVKAATVITPNMTEACFLLGEDPGAQAQTIATATRLATALKNKFGPQLSVVITGIELSTDQVGLVWVNEGAPQPASLVVDRVGGHYFGTGDLFASALTAKLVKGAPFAGAIRAATTFIKAAITATDPAQDPRLGANYAPALPGLLGYRG